jgi:hypothetical protein
MAHLGMRNNIVAHVHLECALSLFSEPSVMQEFLHQV